MEKPIISNRTTFQKSHTCGSLFANCNCSKRSSTDPEPKPIKFNQSYSHPDTSYIFTDENKVPSYTRNSTYYKNHRLGTVTNNDTKRLSSPNIGNYSILDFDVHPEVVLTVSHTNGEIQPLYADTKRDKSTPYCKKSLSVIRSELAKTSSDQSLNKFRHSREEDNNSSQDENKNNVLGYLTVDDDSRRKISNSEFKNCLHNKSLDSATDVQSKETYECASNSSSSSSSLVGINFLSHKKTKKVICQSSAGYI